MAIKSFDGDSWSVRAAKTLLPILIQCAKERRTIYYSEVKELLFKKGIPYAVTVLYGHPAGIVGDALFELAKQDNLDLYPPLNALVIAKANNLPSEGVDQYLSQYLGVPKRVIASSKKPVFVAKVQEEIFAFQSWDSILKALGMEKEKTVAIDASDKSLPPFPRNRQGGGGEGPEHKRLKEFIARNPQAVGLGKGYKAGVTERRFPCADRSDVFFSHIHSPVAVECKTAFASNDELTAGIFQCVKYEALLKAEALWKDVQGTPRSVLVVGRVLPNKHQRLAKRLGVDWILVTSQE